MNKPKILVVGAVCNISGYSEHARTLVDALLEIEDKVDLYISNTQWATSSVDINYLSKYEKWINKTNQLFNLRRDDQGRINIAGLFDITYQVCPPNEFQKMSENDIGVTAALETTFAPPEWVSKCNSMKHILVVSKHAKKNLMNTKDQNEISISTPITVIPFGYDNTVERVDVYKDLNISTKFNFLTVLQLAPRKNFDNMLRWFVEEFKDDEDVGLIVKTHLRNNSTLDFHSVKNRLSMLLDSVSKDRKCKVYLVHGNLSEKQMASLYNTRYINCYITATHGEGFGIPVFNAACNNIPVIATNWSGHLDFLRAPISTRTTKKKIKSHFLKVKYDIGKVQGEHLMPGLITQDCEWAYPKGESFKEQMRLIRKHEKPLEYDVQNLTNHLLKNYSRENVTKMYINFFDIKEPSKEEVEWINQVDMMSDL
jgi:glycosyltransferase involved in cell wall biosynthesis